MGESGRLERGRRGLVRARAVRAPGQHDRVKGLRRLDPGSHGVWEEHLPVMLYKIIEAARRCDLGVLIFDVAQKSRCDQR